MKVSVIIPVLNEERFLGKTLSSLQQINDCEILVVDGGSQDKTLMIAEQHGATILRSSRGRALQMNAGAENAVGEVLIFLHGDSRLSPDGIPAIREALSYPTVVGGAFHLAIDSPRAGYRLLAYAANMRSRITRIPYGDQGLFVRKEVFDVIGGFPPWPLMEDIEFCRRMKRKGKVVILPQRVLTAPRRWEKEGLFYGTVRNGLLLSLFYCGVSPFRLKRWYEDVR